MVWYPFLGRSVFWIGLIISIIIYSKYKKFHPVIYVLSVSLYIFTAGFMMDVFDFQRLGIMITLVLSAIAFMILGYYLSQIIGNDSNSSSSNSSRSR